jgi:membrane-associated phospholipid phosphatase
VSRSGIFTCIGLLSLSSLSSSAPASAQRLEPDDRAFWIGATTVIAVSAAIDEPLRRAAARNRGSLTNALASDIDPFGRAHYLLPALAVAVVAPRLAGRRDLSNAALRIALGYLVADAAESALKPLVGRHRPDSTGRPWRFHALAGTAQWHSLPSAHTVHAFAIAAGLAEETHHPWIATVGYTAASAVALQRVYTQGHWSSDVAVSATLAIAASRSTIAALKRRHFAP